MERTISISAAQINSKLGDKQANFEKIEYLIEHDLPKATDLLVLPEVWSIGWDCSIFQQNAEDINGETIKFLSKIAKKYNINIIGGSFIQKKDNKYHNTCPVFNRQGELIASYDKMHLFSYFGCDEGRYLSEGKNPVLVNIEGIEIGLTTCYDIRFPEIYRAYRKAGADLLVNVAAWGSNKPVEWEVMTRSRAVENQTPMIALTQSGQIKDDEWNLGHSRIIGYKGEILAEIKDQKEGIFSAIIGFDESVRKQCLILEDIKESYEVIQ